MKDRAWLSILLILCLLTGCTAPFSDSLDYTRIHIEEVGDTLGLTPDFSYSVPRQIPNIVVNQVGYPDGDTKVAMFIGQELSPEFQVRLEKDQRVVFWGVLEELGTNEEGTLYAANFSDLREPGRYVLFHPELGYSDSFSIEENVYDKLEEKLLTTLEETQPRSTLELCYQIAGLLFTEELYHREEVQEQRVDEILQGKMELLLGTQDVTTGGVSGTVSEREAMEETSMEEEQRAANQDVSLSATAAFAGVMAMYGSYIQNTDYWYANQCTVAGEKAYRFMEDNLETVNYDLGYFATAQLYKKTGRVRYSAALASFLSLSEGQRQISEQDFSVFADVAYLDTTYKTDLEYSRKIIEKLMQEAEEISASSNRMHFYISTEREEGDIRGTLQDVMKVGVVNYIIANHEYSSLLKNYLHYFLGRNRDASCYVEGVGQRAPENEEQLIAGNEYGAMLYFLLHSIE